jgi:hypothetical protein
MKRLFATACTVALAAALSTNAQWRAAEADSPDSTRYNNRVIPPKAEHPRLQWQKGEINNPHSVENKDQYRHDT